MNNTPLQIMDDFIQRSEGRLTITEAASATGLSIDNVKDALEELLAKYVCRLKVTGYGDLIYDFGQPPTRKDEITPRERFDEIMQMLWKAFAIIYRITIAAVLVVYFIIFFILLIIIIVAALTRGGSSDNRSSSSRSSSSGSSSSSKSDSPIIFFKKVGRIFLDIFDWETVSGGYYYAEDDYGYRYRHSEPKESRIRNGRKHFIASVYDFVFGQPRYPMDPLTNEKEVGQFLRENKGLVVSADLAALAGWTASGAQAFFTDCLTRFQGEVNVSENGVVYGEFDQILRGDFGLEGGEVIYYWDEYEPDYELTGNDGKTDFLIAFLNGFNLVFSLLVVSDLMEKIITWAISGREHDLIYMILDWWAKQLYMDHSAFIIGLGWFPLIFSAIFFAIPLVRKHKLKQYKEKRHYNNIRKRFCCVIFQAGRGNPMTMAQITDGIRAIEKKEQQANYEWRCLVAAQKGEKDIKKEKSITAEQLESIMNDLTLDLEGELSVSEDGKVLYAFPRIQAELAEVEILRRQKRTDSGLGEIIADSGPV